VRSYIQRHAYANTVSDDLWREVEKAAHKPVMAIAHDFTLQPGVPMIKVTSSICRDGKTELALVQDQFRRDQSQAKALHWRVPVVAQVVGGAQARILVDGKATLTLPGCGPVMVNAGQNGYFRTLYAPQVMAPLAAKFATLAPVDQIGLLADTSSMGLAGLQPASDFLDLVAATAPGADPQVWGRVAGLLDSIGDMYGKDEQRRKVFDRFAIARLAPLLTQLGWEGHAGEASTTVNMREGLIMALAGFGDADTIAQARKRYAQPDSGSPALRRAILEIVARYANADSWNAMRAQAQAEKSPLIKDQLYTLLAASKDPVLAKRALELALTDEPGLTISAEMIERVAGTHPEMAFDFALANVAKVNERVDGTSRSRYFPRLASSSVDPAMPAKLKAYAEQHLDAEARGAVEAVIADIRTRIEMRSQRLPAIDAWLAGHSG
jgi:puromycin-sensitive aminopeptidase